MDSVLYAQEIIFDLLDERASLPLGPESLADHMDGGPDILQSVYLDRKISNPMLFTKSGEGFVLSLDNQEIRLKGCDLLLVRVDQSTYPRNFSGFRRVRAESADAHDSFADSERENDLGNARSCADDSPRFRNRLSRIGDRFVRILG